MKLVFRSMVNEFKIPKIRKNESLKSTLFPKKVFQNPWPFRRLIFGFLSYGEAIPQQLYVI